MAEKDDKSLIGFDPLAWMNEGKSQPDESDVQAEIDIKASTNAGQEQKEDVDLEQITTSVEVESETGVLVEPEIQITDEADIDSRLTLESTHNIQNVTQLYERLIKLLESQDRIEIDASAVNVIDTSTLQLLIVLKRNAVNLHKEVIIDFPSDKFIEAADLLGLSEMLKVDNTTAGLF